MSKKKKRFKSNQDASILENIQPFRDLGVVVEAVRFPLESGEDPAIFSKEKARTGMKVLCKRIKGRMRKYGAGKGDIKNANVYMVEGRHPEGRKITFQELWGKGLVVAEDRIALFEEEMDDKSPRYFRGLAWALLNPPMALQSPNYLAHEPYGEGEEIWMLDLVKRFSAEVLRIEDFQQSEQLHIYEWSTDWSTYFNAGHEWWGAYCYTILDPQKGSLTMLAASTTDWGSGS